MHPERNEKVENPTRVLVPHTFGESKSRTWPWYRYSSGKWIHSPEIPCIHRIQKSCHLLGEGEAHVRVTWGYGEGTETMRTVARESHTLSLLDNLNRRQRPVAYRNPRNPATVLYPCTLGHPPARPPPDRSFQLWPPKAEQEAA